MRSQCKVCDFPAPGTPCKMARKGSDRVCLSALSSTASAWHLSTTAVRTCFCCWLGAGVNPGWFKACNHVRAASNRKVPYSSLPPGVAVAFVGRMDLCQLPRLLVLGWGLADRSKTAASLGGWCLSAGLSSRAQDFGRSGPTVSSIGTLLRQSGVARSSCQPNLSRLPCPASCLPRRVLPRRRPANTLWQPRNWKWCWRHWQTRCAG